MHCCVNKGHRRTISRWVETEAEETETLPTVTPSSRSSSRSFTALKIAHSAQGGGPASVDINTTYCWTSQDEAVVVSLNPSFKNSEKGSTLHIKCLGKG